MFNLGNLLAYQLAWLAVIMAAARDLAWVGAVIALIVAASHLALRPGSRELKLMGLCAGIGLLIDSTLAITGQVRFAAAWPADLAPYWMLCLWIAFATTLSHSMRWVMNRPVAAAAAGAVGGPLAYLAAGRLGALDIATPSTTLPLIALLYTPGMIALSMTVMRHEMPRGGSLPA
jgi:hypothetical protein